MLASRVMKLGGTRVWFRKVSLLAGYDQERIFVEGCIRREDKQLQRGLLNAKENAFIIYTNYFMQENKSAN